MFYCFYMDTFYTEGDRGGDGTFLALHTLTHEFPQLAAIDLEIT